MAGSIIPDDWDGTTFNCQKVVWPSSVKWRALLRGQITEPEREGFWDPETGVVQDAIDAVNDAEYLTSPGFWTEDCDVIPGIPVPGFQVGKTILTGLAAMTWTFVPFEEYDYNHNSPDFQLPISQHVVTNPDLFGLWHYDVMLRLQIFGIMYVKVIELPSTNTIINLGADAQAIQLSFDYVWPGAGQGLHLQIYSNVANVMARDFCHWSGHFVGPVSLSE